jgi:hypothetical protein
MALQMNGGATPNGAIVPKTNGFMLYIVGIRPARVVSANPAEQYPLALHAGSVIPIGTIVMVAQHQSVVYVGISALGSYFTFFAF